jgi:hypothetical protein
MELDKLNDKSISINESFNDFGDRHELISKIKALGKNYRFEKYSDEQLYNIWKKELRKKEEQDALAAYYSDKKAEAEKPRCELCDRILTDGGYCPVCDDGAEDFDESFLSENTDSIEGYKRMIGKKGGVAKVRLTNGTFKYFVSTNLGMRDQTEIDLQTARRLIAELGLVYDSRASSGMFAYFTFPDNLTESSVNEGIFDTDRTSLSSWVSMSTPSSTKTTPPASQSAAPGTDIVTVVYDSKAHKLRVRADDGIHGEANVAFPNHLRTKDGQQYKVDQLIWNGKNYRVSGNISPVNTVNSVSNTQNINENNKENYDMNFQSILEELDRLYEELPAEAAVAKAEDEELEVTTEACNKTLAEAADDEEVIIEDEPIVDDEAEEVAEAEEENEPASLALECSKCGAIIIKPEADVTVDDATDLANINDECQFCEEAAGYTIVGVVAPYEANIEENEETAEAVETEDVAEEVPVDESLNEDLVEELEDDLEEGIFDKFKKNKNKNSDTEETSAPTNKNKDYPDNYWVVVSDRGSGTYRYTYVDSTPPVEDKAEAERQAKKIEDDLKRFGISSDVDHFACQYGEAKRLVRKPFGRK